MQSSSWLSSTEFTRIHGFNEHVDVYNTNVVTTKTFTASKYYLNWWNHTHTHGNGVTWPNIEEETDRPHGNVVPPLWSSVAVHVSDNKQSGHWTPTCSTCVLLTYLITLATFKWANVIFGSCAACISWSHKTHRVGLFVCWFTPEKSHHTYCVKRISIISLSLSPAYLYICNCIIVQCARRTEHHRNQASITFPLILSTNQQFFSSLFSSLLRWL